MDSAEISVPKAMFSHIEDWGKIRSKIELAVLSPAPAEALESPVRVTEFSINCLGPRGCDEILSSVKTFADAMDPITTAIIAALGKLAEPAVKDAYNGLKNLIVSKYNEAHPSLPHTVNELEKQPDSSGYRQVLAEEVARAKAAEDPELASAAQSLLQLASPKGAKIQNVKQDVRGNQNIFSGTGDVNLRGG